MSILFSTRFAWIRIRQCLVGIWFRIHNKFVQLLALDQNGTDPQHWFSMFQKVGKQIDDDNDMDKSEVEHYVEDGQTGTTERQNEGSWTMDMHVVDMVTAKYSG